MATISPQLAKSTLNIRCPHPRVLFPLVAIAVTPWPLPQAVRTTLVYRGNLAPPIFFCKSSIQTTNEMLTKADVLCQIRRQVIKIDFSLVHQPMSLIKYILHCSPSCNFAFRRSRSPKIPIYEANMR